MDTNARQQIAASYFLLSFQFFYRQHGAVTGGYLYSHFLVASAYSLGQVQRHHIALILVLPRSGLVIAHFDARGLFFDTSETGETTSQYWFITVIISPCLFVRQRA